MSISTDYSYYSSNYYTQQAAKRQEPSLTSMIDLNEDKALSTDELSQFTADFNEKTGNTLDISSIMSQYDANGDGELDESEQEAIYKENALEKLMASGMHNRNIKMMDGPPPPPPSIDLDGDGSLNNEELTQFIGMINDVSGSSLTSESVLEKYDLDGDGFISQSEMESMLNDIAPPPSQSKSSGVSSNEADFHKKTEELRKYIEERAAKRAEEKELAEDSLNKTETIKQAFARRLYQSVSTYEKSFLFTVNSNFFVLEKM